MTLPTRYLAQSSADGALPTLYAATMPDVPPGAYLGPSKRMETVGPPTFVSGNARAVTRPTRDGCGRSPRSSPASTTSRTRHDRLNLT